MGADRPTFRESPPAFASHRWWLFVVLRGVTARQAAPRRASHHPSWGRHPKPFTTGGHASADLEAINGWTAGV